MGRKRNYSKELKIGVCEHYLNGEGSTCSLAREIGTVHVIVGRWDKKYKAYKESAFDELKTNSAYKKEFKQMSVDNTFMIVMMLHIIKNQK